MSKLDEELIIGTDSYGRKLKQLTEKNTPATIDFNDYTEKGLFYLSNAPSGNNRPPNAVAGLLEVSAYGAGGLITQRYTNWRGDRTFIRGRGSGNVWADWKEYNSLSSLSTYDTWTPTLTCVTASEAPTVTYTSRQGHYTKIKISENMSIVFVDCYIRGNITAVSSGNNYAVIAGLPYTASTGTGSCLFSMFYRGVTFASPMPTGYFTSKLIRIQNGTRGSSSEHWAVGDNFLIEGSGFYFTTE